MKNLMNLPHTANRGGDKPAGRVGGQAEGKVIKYYRTLRSTYYHKYSSFTFSKEIK